MTVKRISKSKLENVVNSFKSKKKSLHPSSD